jgi:hypothetical protein
LGFKLIIWRKLVKKNATIEKTVRWRKLVKKKAFLKLKVNKLKMANIN